MLPSEFGSGHGVSAVLSGPSQAMEVPVKQAHKAVDQAHPDLRAGSTALRRLIEEVSTPEASVRAAGYNRTHNRHNR